MKKLIVGSLIATALYVSLFSNLSKIHQDLPNDGGVFITDKVEDGPIFYPASYSTEIINEPSYSSQNSYTFSSMNYNQAHKYYRGDSVKVAVIDSGLNYTHEDFIDSNSNQIIQGHSRTIDNTSGSWLYYQFSSGYQSKIIDTLGHGTNVASVIASQINAIGCAGIAPNVELYVYKVTNTNNGYEWYAINSALQYCIDEGIDVINMSFQAYEHAVSYGTSSMAASSGCSSVMTTYINNCYNAGITLVAAAGNFNTSEPSYPASNNHVISVGSLAESSTTTKAGFSNLYGIDLVAPGTVYVADKGTNSSYKKTSGTSFSAPIVTAAIALYKQQNPNATPDQIETALYASCDEISGNPSWAGNGRLNIDKFLGVDYHDAPTEIVINNPEVINEELNLEIGDNLDLDWTVNGTGTFDDSVNFYTLSGESNVVTVSSNGRITATGVGEDYVVIESNENPGVYASIYVTVTSSGGGSPTVSSVTVSPSTLSLDLNGTKTGSLTATVNGDNNPSQVVTWSSSNPSVATVSATGVVSGVAIGSTTITATSQIDGSKSGTCTVTVTDSTVHVTGVSLNKNSTEIPVGGSETLVATVSPSNASNKGITWTSSDTSVATVEGGTVSAVATGNATITVKTDDGNRTATCTVTVVAAQTQTLTITRSSFANSGGYAWYDWTQATSDSTSISGKGELYTTEAGSMQFNKSKGNKVGAIFNTTSLPGSITKIEATTASGKTARSWTAYVTSTACSGSGSTLAFGSNKTTVGTASVAVGTSTSFGTSSAGYSYFCLQENDSSASYLSEIKVTYVPKSISSISVKTAPTKTSYEAGEYFNPAGLVITKTFSDNSTQDVAYSNETAAQFTFTPNTSTPLTTSNIAVTIVVGGKSTSQAITVNEPKVLSSISVSGQITSFVEGDTFSFGGTVTAHYTDSTTGDVTSQATFTGYTMTSVGSHTVTVSYGGKSTFYSITISQGTVSSITVSGQTTNYIKNQVFSFDGTCTATFANGYQKTVTPTSVSSPNMSTAGQKEVTVSFMYNGTTVSTTYNINVAANRTVIEVQTTSINSTITWPTSATPQITGDLLSVSCSASGKTVYESSSLRLGTGSGGGTLSISSSSTITKVDVVAKYYSSSYSSAVLKVNGSSVTPLTASYDTYTVNISPGKTSFTILTENSSSRINIQSIKLYSETTGEVDISSSEDCVGLESFIDTYMHMDYVQNLGYCKDNEHHYYSTAKSAFNSLNTHQRSLFTSNTAYANEWARLSAWSNANGDSLNGNNILEVNKELKPLAIVLEANDALIIVLMVSLVGVSIIGGCFFIKRSRKDK